ncbi:uncharacterized protein [Primulina eburnea]|uniref:uncharacterized protein isoform X2 n=1 Tax=Primulina eburnea TaxID=1245227 RepID=UPI003C6C7EE4
MHIESFASWFAKHIENTNPSQDDPVSNDLKSLAIGPNFIGIRYEKFISNGFRFHTKEVECKRKTQNCGVIVRTTTSSYSSIRDQNPVSSELDYYGILQNVIELDYEGGRRVVLFECDWVSKGERLKLDEDGFMLANFTNVKRHNEPYILASQAMQVFYVEDPVDCNWHVIITTDARAKYKMQPMADVDTYLQSCICNPEDENEHEEVVWVRDDIVGVEIDTYLQSCKANTQSRIMIANHAARSSKKVGLARELGSMNDSGKEVQNIQGMLNNQMDGVSKHQHNDLQGMALKNKNVGKTHFQLQDETNTQPLILIDNHTTRNSKERDCQSIQGPSRNQIDEASNQNDIELQDVDSESESLDAEKKTRGPTFMKEIWGRPSTLPRIKIRCDDMGPPIGSRRNNLTDFLGILARNGKFCSIDVEDWHKMPLDSKKKMLDVIKEKYDLPPGT